MASGKGKRQRVEDRRLGIGSSASGDSRVHPRHPPTIEGVRVLVEDRGSGIGSSASGDGRHHPGHPPSEDGVRVRVPVEIKRYIKYSDGSSGAFNTDAGGAVKEFGERKLKVQEPEEKNSDHINSVKRQLNILEKLQNSENFVFYWIMVGMVIHLYALLSKNPNHNSSVIIEVERRIRKGMGDTDFSLTEKYIGVNLLVEDISDRPLRPPSGVLEKEGFVALKNEITDRAISFFLDLMWKIEQQIVEERSRAGRQRKDEDDLLPAVDSENLEIQHLQKEMACLKVRHAAALKSKEDFIGRMAIMLGFKPESGSRDGVTQRPEYAVIEQKLAEVLLELADSKQKVVEASSELEQARTGYVYYMDRAPSPTTGHLS